MVSKAGDGAFGVFDKCRDAVAIPIYLHILTEDEKIQVNLFIRSTFFEKLQPNIFINLRSLLVIQSLN